ncbi:hypothetical protein ASZ90_004251 [hydrocarbon metagenome]|uniref:Uncharacterized protein n=1 Tax=hydrocarbon metagenome TaxID=938273 RepID=A0A0W8FYH5_9ZZZZ
MYCQDLGCQRVSNITSLMNSPAYAGLFAYKTIVYRNSKIQFRLIFRG